MRWVLPIACLTVVIGYYVVSATHTPTKSTLPRVIWSLYDDENGIQTFGPKCPYCREKVEIYSTICRSNGKEFKWVRGHCQLCEGKGSRDGRNCIACRGRGIIGLIANDPAAQLNEEHNCNHGKTFCKDCEGTGEIYDSCLGCNGEYRPIGAVDNCALCSNTGKRRFSCEACHGLGELDCKFCST